MKTRFNGTILTSGVILCSSMCSLSAQVVERPNILMIVCEDISPYLGCYGDNVAVSPNLDRFSEQAIRHTNMFTTVGVSSPSRYSLITGRYPSNDGANFMRVNYFEKEYEAVPPAGVKCYTEYLRQEGYYCTNNQKTDYQFNVPTAAWDEQGADAHWRNASSEQPFFSIFNLTITHESQIWKRSDKPLVVDPASIVVPPYYPDTDIVRHDMAVMYSNVEMMDREFQSLLDELEMSERAENTIVIFYSDNGGPLPRAKRELLESGSNVPFMIRLLDEEGAGEINEDLNMFVDIPATVISLANIELPKNIHGEAMYGSQSSSKPRKYVFGATDRFDEQVEKRASIRDERYQYIYNYMPEQATYRPVKFRLQMPMMVQMVDMYSKGKLNEIQRRWFEVPNTSEELYDCIEDPHQINNLATDPQYKTRLKELRKAYKREWITPYNSEWVKWSEKEFVEQRQPDGVKPTVEPISIEVEAGVVTVLNDPNINSISYRIVDDRSCSGDYLLYQRPITLNKGERLVILMERIGHKSLSREVSL